MQLSKKTEPTKAQIERSVGLLNSVRIVINVLYALMVFQVFLILPRPDDPELKYHTLSQVYSENLRTQKTIKPQKTKTISPVPPPAA